MEGAYEKIANTLNLDISQIELGSRMSVRYSLWKKMARMEQGFWRRIADSVYAWHSTQIPPASTEINLTLAVH
jgi:hypothetical protein